MTNLFLKNTQGRITLNLKGSADTFPQGKENSLFLHFDDELIIEPDNPGKGGESLREISRIGQRGEKTRTNIKQEKGEINAEKRETLDG